MKRIALWIAWTLGVAIAAAGVFSVTLRLLAHDEAAPNDASLRVAATAIPDADNAFIELDSIQRSGAFPDTPDEQLLAAPSAEWNEAYASATLATYGDALTAFQAAATKDAFSAPAFRDPANIDWDAYPMMGAYRQVAAVAALDAERRARAGDVDGALASADAILHVGFAMESSSGPIIQFLVGSAVRQTGLTALRQIAATTQLPAASVKSFNERLHAVRSTDAAVAEAMRYEYLAWRFPVSYEQFLQQFTAFGLSLPWKGLQWLGVSDFYFQPNQTWRLAIDDVRGAIANTERSCATYDPSYRTPNDLTTGGVRLLWTPNAIGKWMGDLHKIGWGGAKTKACNESLSLSATQVALAVSAFRKDHSRMPLSLDELEPAYLPEVTVDPYSGAALQYDADAKTVTSFGPDHSAGGASSTAEDWQHAANPTIVIAQ